MSNARPAADSSNGAQLAVRVLVADQFERSGLDGLAAIGCDVVHDPALKDEALAAALAETQAEVLVVRSTKVTEAMLDAGRLALIVRAGAGYNTIDVAAASVRGIYVSNCPGRNAVAVAELAFGLILALDRRIPDNVADLRAGRWNKQEYAKARGLYGTTLGLLGFGNIAQELARRAQAFGCNLVIWARRFEDDPDPDLTRFGLEPSRPGQTVVIASSPAEVAERADILSVHLALHRRDPGARQRGPARRLRPGALVINTARAEVVDYEALAEAVRERGIRVGLDVYPNEPTTGDRRVRRPAHRPARGLRDAPHRRVDGPGAGGDRRRGGAHRRTRSRTRAGCPTSSTSPGGRRRPTCWSSAIGTGRASSPTCSSTSGRPTSTSRRRRTSCSTARRRRSPGSTSTARPTAGAAGCHRAPATSDILSVQLMAL